MAVQIKQNKIRHPNALTRFNHHLSHKNYTIDLISLMKAKKIKTVTRWTLAKRTPLCFKFSISWRKQTPFLHLCEIKITCLKMWVPLAMNHHLINVLLRRLRKVPGTVYCDFINSYFHWLKRQTKFKFYAHICLQG